MANRPRPHKTAAPAAVTAPTADTESVLPAFGLLGKAGFVLLFLALLGAPFLGGAPLGAAYLNDPLSDALRVITLLGACCLLLDTTTPAPPQGRIWRAAEIAVWTYFGLTVLSLLIHTRFLSAPTFLFAMLPAALDALSVAAIFPLSMRLAQDARARGGVLVALLAGGALAAVFALFQLLIGGTGRAAGPFFSPNFLAGYLALLLPVAAAMALTAKKPAAIVSGLTAALLAGGVAASGSRLGAAAAALGLLVIILGALIAWRGRLPWARVVLLSVGILAVGALASGPLRVRVTPGTGAPDAQAHSGQFRAWTWRGTLKMANRNPLLGTGPGTYPYQYPRYALVGKTDLAHSSYLQTAAETGWPSLLALLAAVVLTGGGAIRLLLRSGRVENRENVLLIAGLLGGVVAALLRSGFDSEWSLPGNFLPFLTWLGLLAGISAVPDLSPHHARRRTTGDGARLVLLGGGLALSAALLSAHQRRDAAIFAARTQQPDMVAQARAAAESWPPDPEALSLLGMLTLNSDALQSAVRVSPSGKYYYRLGQFYERTGQRQAAGAQFERAVRTEPTLLQTRRALAELREKSGDLPDARAAWQDLIRVYEGPAGRIRAIPELPETHPAFAYAALAKDAAQRSETQAARENYEKAARIIEEYSRTDPQYQQSELAAAQLTGADVGGRRSTLEALYGQIMGDWQVLLRRLGKQSEADQLTARRHETEQRFDRMPDGIVPSENTPAVQSDNG